MHEKVFHVMCIFFMCNDNQPHFFSCVFAVGHDYDREHMEKSRRLVRSNMVSII